MTRWPRASEMRQEVWSFALAADGAIDIIIDGELPEAENVVRVRVWRDGDFVRLPTEALARLRQLSENRGFTDNGSAATPGTWSG